MTGWIVAVGLAGAAAAVHAQVAPPSILKEDCGKLKGKQKTQCEARNRVPEGADAQAQPGRPAMSDAPTGADADVPGEPPTPRPAQGTQSPARDGAGAADGGRATPKVSGKPDTSDMPMGKDADPPAESMQPLLPDGTPDPRGPLPSRDQQPAASSSSSSSSSSSASSSGGAVPVGQSSSSADDDDAAPTTAGSDSPIAPGALKDLGSSGKASSAEARAKLEESRVADDVKIGRYYLKTGNTAGAEARFKDALQHDPDDPEATFAMAELLLKQQRNGEARAQLQRYLVLAPDDDHTKEAKKLLSKLGK